MGCGSSQAVSVIQVGSSSQTQSKISEKKIFEEQKNEKSKQTSLIPLSVKKNRSAKSNDSGINISKSNSGADSDDLFDRRSSLSSNQSDGYLDNKYRNVITEKSKREDVEKVEKEFSERNLEISVVGKSCPPLLSKKEKETIQKKEEELSNEMLKNNGLVQKPVVLKQNYALFEIVENNSKVVSLPRLDMSKNSSKTQMNGPPPRLLQREKTKTILTTEEIEDKLEKANQRKQEQLKMKTVNSSISLEKKETDIKSTYSKKSNTQEFDNELVERQKRLKELRDKLKAKDVEHNTPRTPRSKELVSELEKFRPKTASNFKPEF